MVEPAARLWTLDGLGGLRLMRAHFAGHAFARHGHETFAIGVIQAGAEEIRFKDGVERVGPGAVVLINPEVVHTGTAMAGGWRYRVLYPSCEVLTELGGDRGKPFFPNRVSYDDGAARLLVRAHAAAETEDALTAESVLRLALAWLLRAHGNSSAVSVPPPIRGDFVVQARALLYERLLDPPSLEELATATGTRPFTLLRSFREAYGLPPHAFLTQVRVRNAQRLLEGGSPPAEVAAKVGFFDQAHLTRHFRRILGVPPGVYQRGCNFVQASSSAPS
ncbi:AraC family transcriptional regulator [Actinomadura mexicana]|uniref:AraC-type DNA-binding protein n=1 Tax=Actinomadura mexicana TaxID=134959 RepID=A0A239CSH5_9ACTN|nr:AraC family transcriptional regulator [Actinomadura mexicana]SNS22333.1 AraC-type DNA-binding protein [Actinomadura mexicana]